MPRLKQRHFGELIVLHEIFFSLLLEIARKEEMLIPLVEHQADGIIIFVAAAVFIKVIVQDLHFDAVRNFPNALRAVRFVPALQRRVMHRPCRHFRVALFTIISVDRRIFVGQSEVDDHLAFIPRKDARRRGTSRKARNVISVCMRRDDVFEHAVRTKPIDIGGSRIRTGLARAGVDEDIGIARLDIDRVARKRVAQFHKMDGQIAADVYVAARRALYVSVDGKRRDESDGERQNAGNKGKPCGKLFLSHLYSPPPLPDRRR